MDGYYSNHNTAVPAANSDLNGGDSHGARLVMVYTPTDSLKITGSVSYSETDSDPRAVAKVGNANTFYLMGQQLPAGTPADFSFMGTMDYGQWLGTVGSVKESDVALSVSERTGMPFAGSTDETLLSYLKLDWDLGTTIFKSSTSYLSNDATLDEDVEYQDGTGHGIHGGRTVTGQRVSGFDGYGLFQPGVHDRVKRRRSLELAGRYFRFLGGHS